MADIKFKKFIYKSDILHPINIANEKLNEIRKLKMGNQSPIVFEGLFVLVISTFEITLNDTLNILLNSMPDKLLEKSYSISKIQILDQNPLSNVIDNYINAISYKNLEEYFEKFITVASIDKNVISSDLFNDWREFKASRNLLIHNNLVVNDIYIDISKDKSRSNYIGEKLSVDDKYLLSSINCFSTILNAIKIQLEIKYNNLTKIFALKSLWNLIFGKSVCHDFDLEWKYDLVKDEIINFNANSTRSASLSSSEKYIFDFWYSHYAGIGFDSGNLNLRSLGLTARNRFKLLIDNIDLIKCK